jgi:hypothetical protein
MVSRPEFFDIRLLTSERLTALLDSLRLAGYNIGLAQYIAAENLLITVIAHEGWPQGDRSSSNPAERLGRLLGPIVCSNPIEQTDFQRRYQIWLETIRSATPPPPPLIETVETVERRDRRLRRFLTYGVLALIALLIPVLFHHFGSLLAPPAAVDIPENPQPSAERAFPSINLQVLAQLFLVTLWQFGQTEETWISWQAAVGLMGMAMMMAYGIWRLWWRRRAKQFLQRRPSKAPLELETVVIPNSDRHLFPPTLFGQIAQQLRRRVPVPSKEIDVEKTLHASLQKGGWLTPVYGMRKVPPEYLFLIDRSSYHDHQTRFVEEAIARLRQNGVFITCYTFKGDPRVCSPYDRQARSQRLSELIAKYRHHRLLVFIESAQLFRADTGQLAAWTKELTHWRDRVILTPKDLDHWGPEEDELASTFLVLPATVQGLQTLIQSLHEGQSTLKAEGKGRSPFPEDLRINPLLWIQREPPPREDIYTLLPQLQNYLGEAGFQWLCACSVFPKLHWHLTIFLGNTLQIANQTSLLEAASITDLARLPWFRYGYMPDWFREYLIGLLSPQQEHVIRQNLQSLLLTVMQGEQPGGLQLELVNHHPNVISRLAKPVLKRLAQEAPITDGELQDYIFMDFILERNRQSLAIELPKEVQAKLKPGHRQLPSFGQWTIRLLIMAGAFSALAILIGVSLLSNDLAIQWLINFPSILIICFAISALILLIKYKLIRYWDGLFLLVEIAIAILLYPDVIEFSPIDLALLGMIISNILMFLNSIRLRLHKAKASGNSPIIQP